jgi:hypothetical protein
VDSHRSQGWNLQFKEKCYGVKLTKARYMMVDFDCQLDWIEEYLRN